MWSSKFQMHLDFEINVLTFYIATNRHVWKNEDFLIKPLNVWNNSGWSFCNDNDLVGVYIECMV
jgi:hypothetical protein